MWKEIVNKLLSVLQDEGWTIQSVYDGEQSYKINSETPEGSSLERTKTMSRMDAAGHILGVDESRVVFTMPDTHRHNSFLKGPDGPFKISAIIILGNGADEIIADWSYNCPHADRRFSEAYEKFRRHYD